MPMPEKRGYGMTDRDGMAEAVPGPGGEGLALRRGLLRNPTPGLAARAC